MNRSILAAAATLALVPLAASPALATPGGDKWIAAEHSEQVDIVNEMNADLTANDGKLHPASCFGIYTLRRHPNLASVAMRLTAKPALCGSAKDFGVYVLRQVNGHWSVIATKPGKAGATCDYVTGVPAKVTALLSKTGPC